MRLQFQDRMRLAILSRIAEDLVLENREFNGQLEAGLLDSNLIQRSQTKHRTLVGLYVMVFPYVSARTKYDHARQQNYSHIIT